LVVEQARRPKKSRHTRPPENEGLNEVPVSTSDGSSATGSGGPSDETLALRSRRGDLAAFEVLARRYQRRVYTYALRIVAHAQEAEDLTQETLLRAFGSLRHFDARRRFGAWLFGIAAHVCRDCLRRRGRRRERVSEAVEGLATYESPDLTAEDAEQRERVLGAVRRLPLKYREVIVLHYLEEVSYDEVAASLGITPAAARRRALRAREMLRRYLGDDREDKGVR